MTKHTTTNQNDEKEAPRKDRLKTALKANLARRKAQARARTQHQNDNNTTPKE